MSEKKPLTEIQQMAKAALDAEIDVRKKTLEAEIKALDSIDTEKIARKIGETKETE